MKNLLLKIWLPIIFFIILIPSNVSAKDLYSVSIKKDLFNKKERIVAFELKITSGTVFSLTKVPAAWGITINNAASGNANVKGKVEIGVGAFYFDYFEDFIVIEKDSKKESNFKIEMVIFSTIDFEKTKKYIIRQNEIILKKIKQN